MTTLEYRHHIIPFHEWRKRINPKAKRSNREYNASDNVVWLTLAQHIQVHLFLYELNSNKFDLLAADMLSGQIGKEECHRRACVLNGKSNKGRKRPYAPKPSLIGNRNASVKRTNEFKQKNALRNIGNKHALGKRWTQVNRRATIACPHCGKIGDTTNMRRWHFDNCKKKA